MSLVFTLLSAVLKVTFSLIGLAVGYVAYSLLSSWLRDATSPTRHLPGPPSSHWFFGNLKQMRDDREAERKWIARWGRTMRMTRFLGQGMLYTLDTKALHHILTHTDVFQKSEASRFGLGRLVGPGILVVEGEQHRRQRKIMNPAFGPPQVRALTSIFVDKALQLRDMWSAQIAASGKGSATVESLSWFSKASLDIIGLAGFSHDINAVGTADGGPQDELAEAFERITASESSFSLPRFLQMRFPPFRRIPTLSDASVLDAQKKMKSIGQRLLEQSKREVVENGTFETGHGRDLLTLLVKANTSKEVPESQRLCDEDVIAQVPTFLVAGHETTSTALTWALYALTQHPHIQARLREELLSVATDTPTMDELNALPFLECFVREVLRLYGPVPSTSRMAMRDDVIPLGTPFTGRDGVVRDSIRIKKGQIVVIPITAVNKDPALWGPDAGQFVPERWERTTQPPFAPSASSAGLLDAPVPGVWGSLLTFLGGPRGCIGFRFSLVETKALLFTLVRAFEFELGVDGGADMVGVRGNGIVERPILKGREQEGCQLPVVIRAVGVHAKEGI
ncbi:hypothetical protein HMN09_00856600 [Mycena chlorophos]|uniref:Cytochrome P450 n=1 Tax=Mycena chlorophos TaxID=658473 RepID=A0A8H6W9V7_MYCCL|nr:hypothetical protein HMN09_00856600 [Mycena chlorophos]